MTITIVSVNVARPTVLLHHATGDVISAIDKKPVGFGSLALDRTNLDGDAQADTTPLPGGGQVHGGPDKAVYAYSADHAAGWQTTLGFSPPPGYFGENLTVRGVTEHDVRIGDVWCWGDALLQVSQPRMPCYKLGIRMGSQALRREFRSSDRVGWYLRVLRTGSVPTAGEITVAHRNAAGITVSAVNKAVQRRGEPAPEMLDLPELANDIRTTLRRRTRDLTWGVPESD